MQYVTCYLQEYRRQNFGISAFSSDTSVTCTLSYFRVKNTGRRHANDSLCYTVMNHILSYKSDPLQKASSQWIAIENESCLWLFNYPRRYVDTDRSKLATDRHSSIGAKLGVGSRSAQVRKWRPQHGVHHLVDTEAEQSFLSIVWY